MSSCYSPCQKTKTGRWHRYPTSVPILLHSLISRPSFNLKFMLIVFAVGKLLKHLLRLACEGPFTPVKDFLLKSWSSSNTLICIRIARVFTRSPSPLSSTKNAELFIIISNWIRNKFEPKTTFAFVFWFLLLNKNLLSYLLVSYFSKLLMEIFWSSIYFLPRRLTIQL